MKYLTSIIILFCFSIPVVLSQDVTLLEKARNTYKEKNYESALAMYKELTKKNDLRIPATLGMSACNLRTEEFNTAFTNLESVYIDLEIYYYVMSLKYNKDVYVNYLFDIISAMEDIIFESTCPDDSCLKNLYFHYGHIQALLGLNKNAITKMDIAIVKGMKTDRAYSILGYSKMRKKDFTGAESDLKQAIKLNEKFPGAWYILGVLNTEHLNNPKEGLLCFEKALALLPDGEKDLRCVYLYGTARAYYLDKDFVKASEAIIKMVNLDQEYRSIGYPYGLALIDDKKTDEACEYFRFLQSKGEDCSKVIKKYCN